MPSTAMRRMKLRPDCAIRSTRLREARVRQEPLRSRFFFYQHHFPALIVAAVGAGPVRKLHFVAVRALRKSARHEIVMGTPAVPAGLRMTPFRIWHSTF